MHCLCTSILSSAVNMLSSRSFLYTFCIFSWVRAALNACKFFSSCVSKLFLVNLVSSGDGDWTGVPGHLSFLATAGPSSGLDLDWSSFKFKFLPLNVTVITLRCTPCFGSSNCSSGFFFAPLGNIVFNIGILISFDSLNKVEKKVSGVNPFGKVEKIFSGTPWSGNATL